MISGLDGGVAALLKEMAKVEAEITALSTTASLTTKKNDEEILILNSLRKASEGFSIRLGESHPHTMSLLFLLGQYLRKISNPNYGINYNKESENIARRVLHLRSEKLGASHSDYLSSLHDVAENLVRRNVAGTRHMQQQANCLNVMEEAESLYRAALEGRRKILGFNHPETMVTSNQLASMLYASRNKKKEEEAVFLFRLDLQHCEETETEDGDSNGTTIKALVNLGHALWSRHRQREVEDVGRRGDKH